MASHPEFEGKDLEEALHEAAAALDVAEDELHYEIVEQGRRGVFGLGAKSVRIRVMPPLEAASSPAGSEPATDPGTLPASPQRPTNRQRRPRSRRSKRKPAAEPAAAPQEEPLELQPGDEQVAETVQRMVDLMGVEVRVSPVRLDGGLNLKVEGPDRKMLTARNGELQSAIQFLLNRMARRSWPEVGRIHVGEGRSRKRDDDIVALAKRVAQQVAQSGKTKKLQPMNAYERRLVHLTIREYPGLSSSSDGSGSMKRVRVSKIHNAI